MVTPRAAPLLSLFLAVVAIPAAAQDSIAFKQHFEQGNKLCLAGKLDEGIGELKQAIALNPQAPDAYANLGACYSARGRHGDAIAALRKAVELDSTNWHFRKNLGNVYADAGQFDSAMAQHHKVIALVPDTADGYNDLGNTLEVKDRDEDAILMFRRAIELKPHFALAWLNLGLTYRKLRNWPAAWDALIQALVLDEWLPNGSALRYKTGEESSGDLERSVKQNPADAGAHYYYSWALAYRKKGQKAEEEIDRAIAVDSTQGRFFAAKAWFLSLQQKDQDMVKAVQRCVAAFPEEWFCHYVLGYGYAGLPNPGQAVEPLATAARLYPNSANVQVVLGIAAYKTSQDSIAAGAFEKAIALGSRFPNTSAYLCETYARLGQSALKSTQYALAWQYARRAQPLGCEAVNALIVELKMRAPKLEPKP